MALSCKHTTIKGVGGSSPRPFFVKDNRMVKGIIASVVDIVCLCITGISGMLCWNWFVPELFSSAPKMTFATSIGLSIVCSMFVINGTKHSLEEIEGNFENVFWNTVYNQFVNGITKPLILLLYGWILHSLLF